MSLCGSNNVYSNLESFPGKRYKPVLGDDNKVKSVKLSYSPDVMFNEITVPNSYRGALANCKTFIAGLRKPEINHPDEILNTNRDLITANLSDITRLKQPAIAVLKAALKKLIVQHPSIVSK